MHTRFPRAEARQFDAAHFRQALSQFATGVTVITTRLADGTLLGLTASSFNSVSLDPPLVLWSLGTRANSLPVFSGNSHYVINILSAEQAHLAQQFASKMENRFEGVAYTLSRTGQPILDGARPGSNATTAASIRKATTSSSWARWNIAKSTRRPRWSSTTAGSRRLRLSEQRVCCALRQLPKRKWHPDCSGCHFFAAVFRS